MATTKEMLEEVSRRTKLKVSTISDLLEQGWVYVESLNEVRRFEPPESALKVGRK